MFKNIIIFAQLGLQPRSVRRNPICIFINKLKIGFGVCLSETEATIHRNNPVSSSWMSGQRKQQQQQPADHSSDNAEMRRCLIPCSHPGCQHLLAIAIIHILVDY